MWDELFKDGSYERIFLSILLFVAILTYSYFFLEYFYIHFIWIIPLLLYLLFFFSNSQKLKYKDFEEKCKIKKTSEIRILFWR